MATSASPLMSGLAAMGSSIAQGLLAARQHNEQQAQIAKQFQLQQSRDTAQESLARAELAARTQEAQQTAAYRAAMLALSGKRDADTLTMAQLRAQLSQIRDAQAQSQRNFDQLLALYKLANKTPTSIWVPTGAPNKNGMTPMERMELIPDGQGGINSRPVLGPDGKPLIAMRYNASSLPTTVTSTSTNSATGATTTSTRTTQKGKGSSVSGAPKAVTPLNSPLTPVLIASVNSYFAAPNSSTAPYTLQRIAGLIERIGHANHMSAAEIAQLTTPITAPVSIMGHLYPPSKHLGDVRKAIMNALYHLGIQTTAKAAKPPQPVQPSPAVTAFAKSLGRGGKGQ